MEKEILKQIQHSKNLAKVSQAQVIILCNNIIKDLEAGMLTDMDNFYLALNHYYQLKNAVSHGTQLKELLE